LPLVKDFNVRINVMEMANIFRQETAKHEKILCVHQDRPSIFRSAYDNRSLAATHTLLNSVYCKSCYWNRGPQ